MRASGSPAPQGPPVVRPEERKGVRMIFPIQENHPDTFTLDTFSLTRKRRATQPANPTETRRYGWVALASARLPESCLCRWFRKIGWFLRK